jgi:hypothetical protein
VERDVERLIRACGGYTVGRLVVGGLIVVGGSGKVGRRLGVRGHSGWGDCMLTDSWSYLWLGLGIALLALSIAVVPLG